MEDATTFDSWDAATTICHNYGLKPYDVEILTNKEQKMKRLNITSVDALEAAVARAVEKKIQLTAALTKRDKALAEAEKSWQPTLTNLAEQVAEIESDIVDYCTANRVALFSVKKSRETGLAEFGFELTPHRVETANKKIKWKDVVARLLRSGWGKVYVRYPEPQPDKQALLSDREHLSAEQQTAAGIQFCQDEQFFLRPKLETAKETAEAA